MRRALIVLVTGLLGPPAYAAGAPERATEPGCAPVALATLREHLEAGLDIVEHRPASSEVAEYWASVKGEAACPAEPIPAADVARLHLLAAAVRVLASDAQGATAAARAAWAADPALDYEQVAPRGTTLREVLDGARAIPETRGPAIVLRAWRVNGDPAARRLPVDMATYVQSVYQPFGAVISSRDEARAVPGLLRPPTVALLGATAALAAGAAGGLGGAAALRHRYLDPDLSDAEAERLVPANVALGVAGFALGAGAAATLTAAVATWRW